MSQNQVKQDGEYFIFNCPHCVDGVIIVHQKETACCIFRHAIRKSNGQQINPHTPKEECDRLFDGGLIEGCGKPFRFVYSTTGNYVEKCGYI